MLISDTAQQCARLIVNSINRVIALPKKSDFAKFQSLINLKEKNGFFL
jgi:hypothetical protein